MGASGSLRATADYVAAVASLEVDNAQKNALLNRDVSALTELLDGRPTMFCMILAPDDAQEGERPDQADEQTEGDEDQGDKE